MWAGVGFGVQSWLYVCLSFRLSLSVRMCVLACFFMHESGYMCVSMYGCLCSDALPLREWMSVYVYLFVFSSSEIPVFHPITCQVRLPHCAVDQKAQKKLPLLSCHSFNTDLSVETKYTLAVSSKIHRYTHSKSHSRTYTDINTHVCTKHTFTHTRTQA